MNISYQVTYYNMPLVNASKEICYVRYINVQVISFFQTSLISLLRFGVCLLSGRLQVRSLSVHRGLLSKGLVMESIDSMGIIYPISIVIFIFLKNFHVLRIARSVERRITYCLNTGSNLVKNFSFFAQFKIISPKFRSI